MTLYSSCTLITILVLSYNRILLLIINTRGTNNNDVGYGASVIKGDKTRGESNKETDMAIKGIVDSDTGARYKNSM
jgi:hypothetical protein